MALLLAVTLCAFTISAEDTLPEICPHCNVAVEWLPLDEAAADDTAISGGSTAAESKHYYLAFEADSAQWDAKAVPKHVCIYMNGKTVTATNDRVFTVSGGTLSLIGEGTVAGRGFASAGTNYGGAVRLTKNSSNDRGHTINLYGATITTTAEEGRTAASGGAVYLATGTMNVYSGSVIGGTAKNGGSVYIEDTATLNIYGGSVGGGTVTDNGGSVFISEGGNLNVEGGQILAGTATKNGASVYHSGASFTMSGGTLNGGTSSNGGGALYILSGSTFDMSGGQVQGGTATRIGDCVYVPSGAKLILSGSASIDEVKFNSYDPARLLVKGVVTGKVIFRGQSGEADDGFVIGQAENADTSRSSYGIYNTEYYVVGDGTDLKISTIGNVDPVKVTTGYCEVCKKAVDWMAYGPGDYEVNTYLYSGHYYIDSESDVCDWKQKYIVGSDTVCLDLRGKTLVGRNRAFDITKGTLNVMDTVGGGVITASGPSNVDSVYGGTFFVRGPSTLNLYSGKLTYTLPTDGRSYVTRGGVIYALGAVNVYGGEISGGSAQIGANIYMDADKDYVSELGLYGGEISSYVARPSGESTTGICVMSRGHVTISGAPQVAELRQTANSYTPAVGERVTVEGKFTGNIKFRFSSFENGIDLGNAVNADLSGATIIIHDHSDAVLMAVDNELVGIEGTSAALLRKADGTSAAYDTLAAAIEAADALDLVILMSDAADISVHKLLHMDLNGFDITGISGSGTLVCKDNKTDDYNIADGDYGRISGKVDCRLVGMVSGAAYAEDNYLAITAADGTSFHRVRMAIIGSALRPSCAGIYYHSAFYGDAMVAALVENVGVVLNTAEMPTVANMTTTSLYTQQGAAQFNQSATSCLLSGVMKTDNDEATNNANAAQNVYAAAYVKLTDGTILMGSSTATNLREQTASINEGWTYMTVEQKKSFMDMFYRYETVMRGSDWAVSNPVSIADRKNLFETTDYTPYLSPWEFDVVEAAKADGKIHYYFMAGEGLHISDTQTYKDKWGDSFLIVFPNGQTLLVDTGPLAYAPVLKMNLDRMGITHLDAILITHPHSDHHNGAFSDSALLNVGLLESITVDHVYYRGGTDPESTTVDLAYRVSRDLGIPCDVMQKGDVLTFGDVRMECVWPLVGAGTNRISGGEEINNMSIVVRLDYGEHASLLTGDLYLEGEKMILERVDQSLLDVDLLKVPHHGYATSSSVDFINAASPELAVSVGRLPIPARISNRYANLGVTFLDDRTYGYISVVAASDGTMSFETSRTGDDSGVTPDTGEGDVIPDGSEDS